MWLLPKKVSSRVVVITLLLAFVFTGCATLQEKWNLLTPDQKARVIVDGIQTDLESWFDQGKAYVTANPQYLPVWKEKIVPAFDVANKALKDTIDLVRKGELKPQEVYPRVQTFVDNVVALLIQIGVLKT